MPSTSTSTSQPNASIACLQQRAHILSLIRGFFADRKILEVETPLLCHTSVTDPYIQSIPALVKHFSDGEQQFYLQTSPEYAMKRLLVAGSGSIYQLCKAFRQEEIGRFHNPEFSILEWYVVDADHHRLMDEVDALLQLILHTNAATRISYHQLFLSMLNVDITNFTINDCKKLAQHRQLNVVAELTIDDWLMLLMSHLIEPHLGHEVPCFVYDFPASQAALARIQHTHPPVASRFEVYVRGIELANGFHELQNAEEQRLRFENNIYLRKALNLAAIPIDEFFLTALQQGLPNCSGVALGVDRLVMLALHASSIQDVLSFDLTRA